MDNTLKKYKLTIPQENIWLIENLNNDTNINNIFGTFRIKQKLDLKILNDVMNKIVEMNDALRIRIDVENNKPYQYVTEHVYEIFKTYILDSNNDVDINKIISRITKQKINILNNKLYDIQIIQNNVETCVCVKTHHIISDAWTLGQVAEKIKEYYLKIINNESFNVNPSYINYINKDIKYRESDRYLIDKEYWDEYVKELNCENKFEISKDKNSRRIKKQIDIENYNGICNFCEKNKISEYTFFLAIISIYFSQIYNKENIVIGTPFLNRKKADKELDMMGMFIATLPVNIYTKKEKKFIEVCREINSTNLQCFKHSKYPYYEIQKSYQEFTKENINLYEIAFSYQINKLEVTLNGDTGQTTWISNNTQANPLLISYINHFGEHILYYDYILKCLNKCDIDDIHDRIMHIIKQVIHNENIKVGEINVLSSKDIMLLKKFNNTGSIECKETIISRFNNIVENNKNKIALTCGSDRLTYKELDEKADNLCYKLQGLNLDKSAVTIILDKDINFIISILAVLKSGNYYVPILPEEEKKRINFIINDSKTKVIITNTKYKAKIENKDNIKLINIDKIKSENNNCIKKQIFPEDISYLIYTSGTTGQPKGVITKNENIISLINSMNADNDLKFLNDDVAISLLKHSFDASTIDIFSSLLNGGKLVLVPKEFEFDSREVVRIIKSENVTRTFTVHKWIEQIQKVCINEKISLNKLRIIGTGAEILKPKKFEPLLLYNPNLSIYNTYGPTEATVFVTKHKINNIDLLNDSATLGKLMPGTRVVILDKNNNILPIGIKGEIAICEDRNSLHNLAKGYFNKKTLNSEKFIKINTDVLDNICICYKTGDIGKINNDLELEFLGREDDFIKVAGGYLVSINEVEQRIKDLLGNDIESTVIPMEIKHVKTLILFISKKGKSINIKNEEIKTVIDENITFYMKPKHIIELSEIPRNKNGKIDRKKLTLIANEYIKNKNEFIAPRTKLEQIIYDKVKKIIGYDFSITDDFEDDLGLDSLNMTSLYVALGNRNMTIQDLYNYCSVKDLADMMKSEMLEEKNKKTAVKIINNSKKFDISTILITGVTGFVGVNMLKEIAENDNVKKIYCIVRTKIDLESKERFIRTIKEYFDDKVCEKIIKKSIILDGDLTKENLGLATQTFNKVFNEVKTILNCAANVKHIGKYSSFYKDNVKTVINLINICENFNISLAHISTLSLYGFHNKNVKNIFNENVLNINQTFDRNPYLISKYEAEQKIIKETSSNKLNAKIFRIGNIMPRLSDGVFQKNYEQNAFMLAIKEIGNIGFNITQIKNLELYLTPVDECAKAVNVVLNNDIKNLIYHIESDKKIKVSEIISIIKRKNKKINNTDLDDLEEKLYDNFNVGIEHLNSIIKNNSNIYSKDITVKTLKKLNFEWNNLDKHYLENIVNIAYKIK